MADNDFGAEQALNYERKVPCALVIDTSGSMSGSPIEQANAGLLLFEKEVLADSVAKQRVDLTIVTFDSSVDVARDFALLGDVVMPTLTTKGTTRLVDGVRQAVELIKGRIDWYFSTGQDCYRPYLLIITDGAPDADQDVGALKKELQELVNTGHESSEKRGHPRKFNVMTFAVDGAPAEKLAQFSPTTPIELKSQNFRDFFKYIATVTRQVSRSKAEEKIDLSPEAVGAKNPFIVTT